MISGLILLVVATNGLYQVSANGYCVMHDFCGETDTGGITTCSYNGTAKLLKNKEALLIMQEVCPEMVPEGRRLCCSAKQVKDLKEVIKVASDVGLARCPACLKNFRKHLCQLECSPKQSEFLKVDKLDKNDQGKQIIKKLTYFMSRRYADATFGSCKDIQGFTPDTNLLYWMCGAWGKDCNAERWFNFMGSSPGDNGFSPVEVEYHLTTEATLKVDGVWYTPMDVETPTCPEFPHPNGMPCSCHCLKCPCL